MKQHFYMFVIIIFFVMMLCFPSETFIGAQKGLLLWFQTLLPTLLPFIVLSNLLVHTNSMNYLTKVLSPVLKRMFRISKNGCYAVFVGFLCGYPMGAKVIDDLIISNRISHKEGAYLLSFCNNTSPMFIISFIVMQNLKRSDLLLGTLLILILSPVLCSFLFRKFYKIEYPCRTTQNTEEESILFNFRIIDDCIMNGFETITKIGGYVILFSIILKLASHVSASFFLSVLEISNGIPYILSLKNSFNLSYPAILALTSFGGCCALAQTNSMIQASKLPIIPYIIQKLITAMVTSFLALLYIQFIH